MIDFVLASEVLPKRRPRSRVIRTKSKVKGTHYWRPVVYTDPEQEENKQVLAWRMGHYRPDVPMDGPLWLVVVISELVPQSRAKRVEKSLWQPRLNTPDLDNHVGQVMDALQASAFVKDDRQFAGVLTAKIESVAGQWLGVAMDKWPKGCASMPFVTMAETMAKLINTIKESTYDWEGTSRRD